MRFRRPTDVPPLPHPAPRGPGRKWLPWLLSLGFTAAVALGAWFWYAGSVAIKSDGVVMGDPTVVASLYPGRVVTVPACFNPVLAGEPLYSIANDLLLSQLEDGLLRQEDRVISTEAEIERIEGRIAIARERHRGALALLSRYREAWEAHDRLLQAGVVTRVEWQQARAALENAQAEAGSRQAEIDEAMAALEQAHRRIEIEQDRLVERQSRLGQRFDSVHSTTIVAPISGILVDCTARSGEVIAAGAPLAQIFDPREAYVMAFFDLGSLSELHVGRPVSIEIRGVPRSLTGTIVTVDPAIRDLPDQLRRFFWQAPQWAQFVPVRVALPDSDPATYGKLRFGMPATIRIGLGDPIDGATQGFQRWLERIEAAIRDAWSASATPLAGTPRYDIK